MTGRFSGTSRHSVRLMVCGLMLAGAVIGKARSARVFQLGLRLEF